MNVPMVIALVMILPRDWHSRPAELSQYAWLALSAVVGTWGVLIPAKLC